ncbi:MAG: YidC/Oxa1 family membrane protein insertase [Bacillota bacterium]|nr:YidC/Oxa1 family membrane protein insertase [Bacillota bacterium]
MAWLSDFMRQLLDTLFRFTGSYGLAIILITLVLRIVLLPLTAAGMRSSFKMQAIDAERKELAKKYKKDQEQLNRATMELWKRHKVNPFAGCLTMLVQLPIIFGFIGALRGYEFAGNPAFLWVPHLGEVDPYYILPILAAIGTFVQSKLTTPATDASMQTMTYLFPVLVLAFGFRMPAAFTLYWVASSLFSVVERFLIIRPAPKEAVDKA